jgi:hypothetical protein
MGPQVAQLMLLTASVICRSAARAEPALSRRTPAADIAMVFMFDVLIRR